MSIVADVILSLILLGLGYAFLCAYLSEIEFRKINLSILRPNRNRCLYLATGTLIVGVLIILFQIIHTLDMISQLKLLTLILTILPLAAADLRVQKMPNKILLVGLILRMCFYVWEYITDYKNAWEITKDNIIGALVVGVFFFFLMLIFKNSIGMGDIKLFALMGLYEGLWGVVNSVFYSLLISFVVAIVLLITKKKKRKDTMPFGPCILLGTAVAMAMAGM